MRRVNSCFTVRMDLQLKPPPTLLVHSLDSSLGPTEQAG